MSLLLAIDFKNNQLLHPEVKKLIPTWDALTEQEMLYVILFTDYNSPFKQFPEHERRRRSMWKSFGEPMEDLVNSPKVKMAIDDYMSLQYNRSHDLIKGFQAKVDKLMEQLDLEPSPSSIEKIDKAIEKLLHRIKLLEESIDEKNLADGVIKGDRKLSYIEVLLQNRKVYESVITKE